MSGFGNFDKNGDGLCLTEFVKYLKAEYKINISESTAKDVFNDIDKRNADDDRISWAEWSEFLKKKPFKSVQSSDLQKMFGELDTDGSGKVSFEELLSALSDKGYNKEEVTALFDKIDKDDNNVITQCEWNSLATEMTNK